MRKGAKKLFNGDKDRKKRHSEMSSDTQSEVMVEIVSGKIEMKMDNVVIKDLLKWVIDEKQETTEKSFKTMKDKENLQNQLI